MLFDRGFAMSATGQKLDALPASAVTAPPDMRDEICHGRGRAGDAGDAGGVRRLGDGARARASFGRARAARPMLAAPMEAPPPSAPIADEKRAVRAGPGVRRPEAGLDRPGARRRGDDVEEATPRRSAPIPRDKDAKPDEARGAAWRLKSAVKPPAQAAGALHVTPQARARMAAAARRVAQKAASSSKSPHALTRA